MALILDTRFALTTALPLAEMAYSCRPGATPQPMGLERTAPISTGTGDVYGFYGWLGNICYIVFRGTENRVDWLRDFDCATEDWYGHRVHRGIGRLFDALLPSLPTRDATSKYIVIGHSLGAGPATLTAFYMGSADLYTFESPRVGDQVFAAKFNGVANIRHFRIANAHDLVTHLAPRPLYAHCGSAVILDGWSVAPTFEDKLALTYQHSLELTCGPCLKRLPPTVPTEILL